MEELATYIAGEMNANINSPEVRQMRDLNSFDAPAKMKEYEALPFYLRLGPGPDFYSMAAGMQAKAFAIWAERVGQNRPWDHKPILAAKYDGVVYHKQGNYDYFYDIWSNIHYGYVGRVGGLSESILLDGAGAEQIVSDTGKQSRSYRNRKRKENFRGLIARPTLMDSVHGTTPQTGFRLTLGSSCSAKIPPVELRHKW